MNEVILELILMAVMAFFMIFGLIGCQHEKKMGESSAETKEP
ncbi:MAG: hypothetical protein Q3Y08_07265 [Butyricicoccus sp.]|nr:hypothetical protein [Butyricicoccus sp.]